MKKSYILLCALAALAAASCTEKEKLAPAFTGEKVTREFSTVLTKTTLHTDGATVYWEDTDAISIFDGTSNNKFDIKDYTSPSYSATFSGEVDAGATSFYAVYPYAAGNALAGSTLTAEVPAAQTLKADSFQSGAAVAVAYTTGSSLAFHQATAILGITLDSDMDNVESIEFYGNNNEYVAGAVDVAMNTSNGAITSVTPGTGSKKVTLTGTFAAGETYYLSFIPQTFSNGVTVLVNFDGDKTGIVTSNNSLATVAGMSYPIANFTRISLPKISLLDKYSFNYDGGSDQNLVPESSANIASITVDSAPAGWEIAWNTNLFDVTPPTQAEIQENPQTVDPEGVFELTLRSAAGHTRQVEIPVRLYGINSLDDLKALQDNNVMDTPANATPYLVNAGGVEELTLNTDLTLVTNDLKSKAIALHHNAYPINGNGRTVTYDNVTVAAWPAGFVQNLQNNVHDINFAGSIKNTAASANVGALAARGYNISGDEIVITNVMSDVDITWTAASSNTYIGGLVGWMYYNEKNATDPLSSSNKSITFTNCTVTGDITLNGELTSSGGIIGQGEKYGRVSTAWTTLDGCTYSGTLTYRPDATQNKTTRIGGLVGNSERQLKLKDCLVDGSIEVYLENKIFGKADHDRAIGGVVGRTVAQSGTYADPHCMAYRLSNVKTSANINVHGTNLSEVKDCFQIRAYGLCARTDLDGNPTTYNVELIGGPKITFDNYAGPEINGVASPVSFSYGETKDLDVTTGDLSEWTVTAALEGWTVNTDHITDGSPYITVTAPTQDAIKAGSAVGAGDIAFTATHATLGAAPTGGSGQAVRLYGINNKAEFDAFKTIYTPLNDTRVTSGFDDYLVDGKITLNTDLTINTSDLYVVGGAGVYVIKFLYDPLEGNNRTITYDINSAGSIVGFFQGVRNDVSNLNFAGTLKVTNKAVQVGALASRGGYAKVSTTKDPTVLTSVNSSTHIIYAPTAQDGQAMIGGLIGFTGQLAGGTQKINDCTVSGIIENQTYAPWAMGGIVGSTGTTVDPLTDLNNCTFSGTINYSYSTNAKGSRVGGMIGENGRQATIDDCKFSGQINAYMNSSTLPDNNYGIGGVVGRTTNSTTSGGKDYTMKCHITNYTYSGTITAYDAAATTRMGTCIGTDAGHPVTLVDGVRPLTTVTSYNFPGKTIQTASSD